MESAKWIIWLGFGIVLIGVILYLFPNAFKWFGNLPGDIKIERENSKFYFPIVTMVIISIVANVLIRFFR